MLIQWDGDIINLKGPAGWHIDGIKFDPILKWIHHENLITQIHLTIVT